MPKHYPSWIEVASEFWLAGMYDKHPLQRHREILEAIADHATAKASEVDFSETMMSIEYTNTARPDRNVWFMFWKLHGKSEIQTSRPSGGRPTPANIKTAFEWMYEPLPKRKKAVKTGSEKCST